ncbi:hypothetical protein AKJ49_01960 [candidate division MSBL1 archaeon SCGC-AAA382A03]|uniref:DNase n=1 Tax=candidate division MSBL1 archaeon SCGC-AAA382A03 TaxID=1698278 RepID=A0A133VDP0_9EURY|nr:hypothetical protein AKJ49_01960 [candidate division MSBL1 archaeon SCGC-AAA382A03]
MIDSHCHLEFNHFDKDREKVIEKSRKKLKALIDSSAGIESFETVLTLHRDCSDFIFSSLGLHPTRAVNTSEEELEDYKKKIEMNKREIVGVGEVGLDYHHIKDKSRREKSKKIFSDFTKFSDELNLPLIVHSRNSMEDALNILSEKDVNEVIIHCFAGNINDLEEALDRDYYLSFGGIIFRAKDKYENILKKVPLENLLLETDSPFLAKRKNNRAEPWFIKEVGERIAKIKGEEFYEVWKTAGRNAKEVFDLPVNL